MPFEAHPRRYLVAMAQSGVGSYSNPLKKFKYAVRAVLLPTDANTPRLVFLGEQSGMRQHPATIHRDGVIVLTAHSGKDLADNKIHV